MNSITYDHAHCLSVETADGAPCQNPIAPGQKHCYLHGGLPHDRYATNGLDAPLLRDTVEFKERGTLDEETLVYGEDAMDGLASAAPRLLPSRSNPSMEAPSDAEPQFSGRVSEFPVGSDEGLGANRLKQMKRNLLTGHMKGRGEDWTTLELRTAAGTVPLDDDSTEWGSGLVKANLREADLSHVDFSDLMVQEADLRGAVIEQAVGNYGTDFGGADMRGAELSGSSFPRVSFDNADLREANIHITNMRGTNCRGVDFRGAVIAGSDFAGADLSGADFRGAVITNTVFGGADLSGAKFDGDIVPSESQLPWTNAIGEQRRR